MDHVVHDEETKTRLTKTSERTLPPEGEVFYMNGNKYVWGSNFSRPPRVVLASSVWETAYQQMIIEQAVSNGLFVCRDLSFA